ncbi:hypothetical protein TVAG_076860 [Trichomonas vaginalis G3]|uniref:Uncharacterized protein n=1 Tax=Trichomonas vaginalis (strain ATCC PRA-98 / G3) TaxID=412133 RepID=A2D9T3_TRIV3|nr:spectrin binding [Trichomonas vaginalis G3]EAY22939.1 hypothetical protein TVAG_076860 [Trichomonas vaginalis G3]KAI5527309.1 spectrin binding [Trichomonas vaginalis G3]|eukprot:XP_001583925.1 hypothetical protein [Trichomonas vaginalis G3]
MNSSKWKVKLDDVIIPPQFKEILDYRALIPKLIPDHIPELVEKTVETFHKQNAMIIANEMVNSYEMFIKYRKEIVDFIVLYGQTVDNSIFEVFFDLPTPRIHRLLYKAGVLPKEQIYFLKDPEITLTFFIEQLGANYLLQKQCGYSLKQVSDYIYKKDFDSIYNITEYGYVKDSPGYYIVFDDVDNFIKSVSGISNLQTCTFPVTSFQGFDSPTETILDIAAYHGALKCLNYLFSLGFVPTSHTFEFSILSGNFDVVQLVYSKGSNFDPLVHLNVSASVQDIRLFDWICSFNPAITDPYSEAGPFMHAISVGNYQICFWILQNFPIDRTSVVFDLVNQAAGYNEFRMIDYILDLCNVKLSDPINEKKAIFGEELLLHVAQRCGTSMIQWLLDRGVNINCRGSENVTPLQNAVSDADFRVIKYLVEHGAEINTMDNNHYSPLWNAIGRIDSDIANYLLERGADPNVVPQERVSCLHIAAAHNMIDTVKLLLEKGALIDPCDSDGKTPLNLAAGTGRYQICKILLDHGANVNSRDLIGMTPYINATWNKNEKCAKLFFEHGVPLRSVKDCQMIAEEDSRTDNLSSDFGWDSSDEEFANNYHE